MSGPTYTIVASCLVIAVLACSDSMMSPVPDVSGDWAFSDSVSATFGVCTASGIAMLGQEGRTISGVINASEGLCTWADGGSNDNAGPVEISAGEVTDTSITFSAGICHFQGRFVSEGRIEGDEVCSVLDLAGQTFELIGPFSLSR